MHSSGEALPATFFRNIFSHGTLLASVCHFSGRYPSGTTFEGKSVPANTPAGPERIFVGVGWLFNWEPSRVTFPVWGDTFSGAFGNSPGGCVLSISVQLGGGTLDMFSYLF